MKKREGYVRDIDLSRREDAYSFRVGATYVVLDNTSWRLARWTDRLRWKLRGWFRFGVYSRVVAVNNARGAVTVELIRWSWLRWKWVRA